MLRIEPPALGERVPQEDDARPVGPGLSLSVPETDGVRSVVGVEAGSAVLELRIRDVQNAEDRMVALVELCLERVGNGQISRFDTELFDSPTGVLEYLSFNLVTQAVVTAAKLWGDPRRDSLPLERTAAWILKFAVRSGFRAELEELIRGAEPSQKVQATIERFRKVRHAQLAHLGKSNVLGLEKPPSCALERSGRRRAGARVLL